MEGQWAGAGTPREQLRHYIDSMPRAPALDPRVKRWMTAKRTVLALLLTLAFLQYHLLDVMLQMFSLSHVITFTG